MLSKSMPNSKWNSWPILSLAFFFSASGIGVVLGDHFGKAVQYLFVASAPLGLWLFSPRVRFFAIGRTFSGVIRIVATIVVLIFISLIAGLNIYSDVDSIQNVFAKSFGMALNLLVLLFCVRGYSSRQIVKSLILFAVSESILILTTFQGWNPNGIAVRCATIGFIAYSFLPVNAIRWVAWIGMLVPVYMVQSRTSLVASILALVLSFALQKTKQNRMFLFLAVLGAFTFFVVFGESLQNKLKTIAKRSLGSSNPVAEFFLSDKDSDKIDSDFLDRQKAWSGAAQAIQERPILGVGMGNIGRHLGGGAHNAWLTIAVEGGLPQTLIWALLYLIIARFLFFERVTFLSESHRRLMVLAQFLLMYMVFSGVMESSGLASIMTPNNLICLFVAFWAMANENSGQILSDAGHVSRI